jgi:hypothetical protein
MKKIVNITELGMAKTLIKEMLLVNTAIDSGLNFADDAQTMVADLGALMEREIGEDMPSEWAAIIESAMARVESGEQLHAVQYTGGDVPCRNDTNGFDHYRLNLSFLDAQDNDALSVTVTFVEVRDIDGWSMDKGYDPETHPITVNGVTISQDGDDYSNTIGFWEAVLLEIYNENTTFYSYPKQAQQDAAERQVNSLLIRLQEVMKKIPA